MSFRLAVLLVCASGLVASAQTSPVVVADSLEGTRQSRSFGSAFNLRMIGGFAMVTAVALPFDEAIRDGLGRAATQSTGTLQSMSRGASSLAMPGAYIAGYAIYGAGLVSAQRPVADAGFHTLASVIIASNVADLAKAAVGRTRPSATNTSNQFAWGAPRQDGPSYAFPSGHATAAFAGATALAEELSHSAPRAARYVNPLLYLAATTVGLSRVSGRAHWASDVVAGAAVGTLTARAVVRGAHSRPGNIIDRIAVHAIVSANQKGRVFLGAAF